MATLEARLAELRTEITTLTEELKGADATERGRKMLLDGTASQAASIL